MKIPIRFDQTLKRSKLEENLNEESVRIEAAEVLRGLIREIRLIPEEGELQIELVGDIPSILAFSNESPGQASSAAALITLVAGEGVEPPTLGL